MRRGLTLLLLIVAVVGFAPTTAQADPLNLTLLVDISGSVDASEFALQRTGYVNAFNDAYIQGLIVNAGGIAARLIYWSGVSQQYTVVDWTNLTDATSAGAFATAIGAAARQTNNLTAPGSAINYAYSGRASSFYPNARMVFDVSGDGSQNDGANTFDAATAAHAAGVIVNGLAILGSESGLQTWYQNNIVTPGGGSLWIANDFGDFDAAIRLKIGEEIAGIPEPASMLLLGTGLLGLGRAWRKRRG